MKLKITLVAALALSLLVVPQALAAPGKGAARKAAQAACRAELKENGKQAFRAAYGRQAMRACVAALRDDAVEAITNAAQDCRAEREADPDAFREKYGTNGNKRNAFGKCVSSHVREEMAGEADEATNAAQECRAEQKADPAAFREKYGTNRNKRNAFGKCVAAKSDAADEEEESEEGSEGEEGEGEGETPPPPPAPPAP